MFESGFASGTILNEVNKVRNVFVGPHFGGPFVFLGLGPVSVCESQEGTTKDLVCSRRAVKRDRKKPRKQEGNHNRKIFLLQDV